ncbi:FtsX-like permease family protein [Aquibacillus halophilus]|uniref:FtsX-like permease family protein n=1 Tax=Aquibacillus halophilus TaxID=930132 RepID=A0A6A8DDA2_9BACI|nr:FtsX-like permease family protein [Aquibacillus halophilus]MRH42506.1 FtsX-like permease family protein [Aquibacillus halophilus]
MTIFKIIFRKMLSNRWLTGSLFLGLLITVSLVSSIPTYTSSVMQKLLLGDLENYQLENNSYPTTFSYSVNFSKDEEIDRLTVLDTVEEVNSDLIGNTEVPTVTDLSILSTTPMKVTSELEAQSTQELSGRIVSFTSIEDHITITDGKLPSKTIVEGVYETLVTEKALLDRDMVIGTTFTIGEGDSKIQVKPVGTFIAKNTSEPYWVLPPDSYSKDFIVFEELFKNELIENNKNLLETGKFVTVFDYTEMKIESIPGLLGLDRKVNAEVSSLMETIILVDFPIQDVLKTFETRSDQLKTMLWSLNVPVLVMLGIYLYMVSRLIINRQLNEIAVFTSRGAKRAQILLIYFTEIAILGIVALAIGPYLGLLLCNILGGTNGFLEFVQRTALPTEILPESYLYALFAVLASILMIMIPVYFASNQSIVNHKQNLANSVNHYKWYSIIFDLTLIGVSIYGLYSFQKQRDNTSLTMADGEMYIDPILFFLPAIFIIGFGLFILRIYPLVLKLIYKIGERFWSISLYSTFLQVSRSAKQYQFLMLFLIMTIGIGVYSASAARTINNNLVEQIRYQNGADITLDVRWETNEATTSAYAPDTPSGEEEDTDTNSKEVVYTEPPFEPILELEDVENATRVFTMDNVNVEGKGKSIFSAELMAIEPKKFGQTAWFKPTLLPHHWYEYLNLIASEPSAALISKSVSTSLGVKEGDYITLQWDGSDSAEFVVYGIVDYWPSFNPLEIKEDNANPTLIVTNLSYVQNLMGLEPYQAWLKVKPNSTRNSLYESIKKEQIPVMNMVDVQPQIIELKNSAFLLGLNGTLTLGFIISIFVTFIGFLLYWILTIKSRTLQYGVYRAMGIPMPKLIGILIWEQVMTSGIACFLGVIIGGVTSKLFVPLFQLTFNPQTMVPPFVVVFDSSDEMKIYLFVTFMFVVGLSILVVLLRKIKIHQAIKLGED